MNERSSEAETPPLISDPQQLAEREAENALAQFDWAMQEVERWLAAKKPTLRISVLLRLHQIGMEGIDQYAGNFRPAAVRIIGSTHEPISRDDVPRHVEDMFDYIENNWSKATAIHLSAYAMWRLNWIHPFADGNGRTSRIISYMILCSRIGKILPGVPTIPEQISENKSSYYSALERADLAYRAGGIDVTEMERLIEGYLANQLVTVHEQATGRSISKNLSATQTKNVSKHRIIALVEAHPALTAAFVGVLGIIATIVFS